MGAGIEPRSTPTSAIEDYHKVLTGKMTLEEYSKPQPRPLPKVRSVEDMPRQVREQGPSLRIASFLYLRRAL